MARRVNPNPDNLSFIPQKETVDREASSYKLSSDLQIDMHTK